MATRQDFALFTKSDYKVTVTVRDELGDLLDLTGAELHWVMLSPGRGADWLRKSSLPGGGIEILDQVAEKGKFRVTIAGADSEQLPSAVAPHEAVLILGGIRSTIMYGTVSVQRSGI